ncbi:hypothetical protein NQ176_g5321 [Zarea fungicola]|uniref:Uncharacterized protein n=1 Tax=Zarea fungicola TaxID=93591 RepID=A0ACC1N935_9HYPO|nr:hypothetical protein NQ176_g5321 [Lecanicillium fungicola]
MVQKFNIAVLATAIASHFLGFAAARHDSGDTIVEVQYQPYAIVCSGKTTTSTAVQTVTKCNGKDGYVTITEPGPVATTRTIPPKDGHPGTVIIDVPSDGRGPGYVTVTQLGPVPTTFTIPPNSGHPGTVIVQTTVPATNPGYVTITEPGPVATTRTIPPKDGYPGTVIIDVPTAKSTAAAPTSTAAGSSTSSSTSISSSTTSKSPSCTAGVKWAYYKMAQASTDTASGPGKIPYQGATDWIQNALQIETVMQGNPSPDSTGTTEVIGVPSAPGSKIGVPGNNCGVSPPVIYGTTTSGDGSYFVVHHIGYFHPDKSGDYRFALPDVDDGMYLWLGDKAKSGWTTANADLYAQSGGSADHSKNPFHYTATAGEYVPFRATFVQAERCAFWNLTIQDPTSKYIESADIKVMDNQLTFGCGSNTPDFDF